VPAENSAWSSHAWNIRELELDASGLLIQHTCADCGRNFVEELRTGEFYAVHVGATRFDRLSDEITARWLVNFCPRERLESDQADLETSFSSYGIESGSLIAGGNDAVIGKPVSKFRP
jgi:hypothetical protein